MEMETLTSTDGPTPLCGRMTKGLTVTNALMATMREDDDDKDYIHGILLPAADQQICTLWQGRTKPRGGKFIHKEYTNEDD